MHLPLGIEALKTAPAVAALVARGLPGGWPWNNWHNWNSNWRFHDSQSISNQTDFTAPTTAGGLSTFGTLDLPYFPKYLTNGSASAGCPWDERSVTDNCYEQNNVPVTNVTRYYTLTVAQSTTNADGVVRNTMTVNGQFPGPVLEANWGDWLEITVVNNLGMEGTSMHWHGLRQIDAPWMDGVPSLSQCPIAPGQNFTYRFRAEVYGSSWYHAHYSAQNNAGIVGPMIFYGPSSQDYDVDIGPVLLTDWYHKDYYSLVAEYVGTDLSILPFTSDNNLIQGRNSFPCALSPNTTDPSLACADNAALSAFKFVPGKTHRLRLVNAGTEGVQKFSIDGHNMTVIAQDFVSVQPFETDIITLGVGQRTDVLVTANAPPGSSFWMRSTISSGDGCSGSANPAVTAAIFYDGCDTTKAPTSTPNPSYTYDNIQNCRNDDISTNFVPSAPLAAQTPSVSTNVSVNLVVNSTGHFNWELNNVTFHADYNVPIAAQASHGNLSFPAEWQVYNYGSNGTIQINLYNNLNATHPWHIHGRDMLILSSGPGEWDGTVTNPSNPVRRDTHIIQNFGHLVMQFPNDNPGVWPFHCHIAWHLSGGLYMNLLLDPANIKEYPEIIDDTCTAWDAWSNRDFVDEVDSGL